MKAWSNNETWRDKEKKRKEKGMEQRECMIERRARNGTQKRKEKSNAYLVDYNSNYIRRNRYYKEYKTL